MDFKPFKMGKYLLMERLATGGMAEVYRAKAGGAGGFEKQVAIKRILPSYSQNEEFRKMFEYEARLSSMLTHANIVQVYDFNKFGETYLLALEYVDGKNLRQFVNKARKLDFAPPMEFSAYIVNEVCKGLEYAHTKKDDLTGKPLNIIHRDMSPQNIMISYDGAVKIVDFGIAKAKDRVDETRSGIIKGKFGYMSPEQANGMPVDHRTDIFSTGIILWELLTSRRLFVAESDLATLRLIQECVIPPPSKINPRVPPELDRIVMKTLSKDLKLRFSSAGDLHRHLLDYLNKSAPTFTQREVAAILHKVFAEEISKEKRRYEQLYRQSIPFSQGTAKGEKNTEMAGVEEALDGLQTKSDVAEDLETFSDDSQQMSAIKEDSQPNMTRSQVSVPTEEEPSSTEAPSAPPEPQPTVISSKIELEPSEEKSLEIVLPGGGKKVGRSPGKWKGANILPMSESDRESSSSVPAPVRPPSSLPEPEIESFSAVSTLGEDSKTLQGRPAPKAPAPTPVASTNLEMERPKPLPRAASSWGSRPLKELAPPRSRRRRIPSLVPLLFLLGITAYVYKLYLDGEITAFIQSQTPVPEVPVNTSETSEGIPNIDRKPVGDCTLNVRSDPPGAEVRENNIVRGLTPLMLSGPCHRSVNITLRKEGYDYLSENVVINPRITEWGRALKPVPTGRLALSLGFNAEVYINDERVGEARAGQTLEIPLRAKRTYKLRLVNSLLNIEVPAAVTIEQGRKSDFRLTLDQAVQQTRRKGKK